MKRMLPVAVLAIAAIASLAVGTAETVGEGREAAQAGHAAEAYAILAPHVLSPEGTDQLGSDFAICAQALERTGSGAAIDEFRDAAIKAHGQEWKLLWQAAKSYRDNPHSGLILSGKFVRGAYSATGTVMDCTQRDRICALQLMQLAMEVDLLSQGHRGFVGMRAQLLLLERDRTGF